MHAKEQSLKYNSKQLKHDKLPVEIRGYKKTPFVLEWQSSEFCKLINIKHMQPSQPNCHSTHLLKLKLYNIITLSWQRIHLLLTMMVLIQYIMF